MLISISIIFYLTGCSIFQNKNTPHYPDEVDIYSLGLSKNYLVGVQCGEVGKHTDADVYIEKNQKKIHDICILFSDTLNFTKDTFQNNPATEVRIELDYIRNGAIYERLCISPPLQFNQFDSKGRVIKQRGHLGWFIKSGNVYRFMIGGKIDNLLNSYKLIRP